MKKMICAAVLVISLLLVPLALAYIGQVKQVTIENGKIGNSDAWHSAASDNGRYVTYTSGASNTGRGANGGRQVFWKDTQTGKLRIASRSPSGRLFEGLIEDLEISPDGQWIAFTSNADINGYYNGIHQAYLWNAQSEQIQLVSQRNGIKANEPAFYVDLSKNAEWVVFSSGARNLTDGNVSADNIYRYNRFTGETNLVTLNQGQSANGLSSNPTISSNGRYIAYQSRSTNQAFGTRAGQEILLWDANSATSKLVKTFKNRANSNRAFDAELSSNGRFLTYAAKGPIAKAKPKKIAVLRSSTSTRKGRLASITKSGRSANNSSDAPTISPDGRFVAFQTKATNLGGKLQHPYGEAIYYYDFKKKKPTLGSVQDKRKGGQASKDYSIHPSISKRHLFFSTPGYNIGKTRGYTQLFKLQYK